jgi:hypothetical protein
MPLTSADDESHHSRGLAYRASIARSPEATDVRHGPKAARAGLLIRIGPPVSA